MATLTDRIMVLPTSGIPQRVTAGDTLELSAGSLIIGGDLTVSGTKFTNEAETVLVSDNHTYMNAGYNTAAAQTGGLVVNYLPTAVTAGTTGGGVFVAGVDTTSDPTVTVDDDSTFATGDLVQVSGTANGGENDGLYEVASYTGAGDGGAAETLTIRSTSDGVTNQVEDFTDGQFIANAGDTGATVTKVTVSVLRAGTDGAWETGSGATTGITFDDLGTAAGSTLQAAYAAGNTITLADSDGDLVVTLDDAGAAADFQVTDAGGDYILTDAANNTLDLGSAANSVDFVGSAGVTSTGNGSWDFGTGQADFGGNVDATAGLDIDADSVALTIGAGADLSITHNGTNTVATSATGDLVIDNTNTTGSTINQLGTDTAATDFQVQNDSGTALLTVDGSGQADLSGNLDVSGGLDIDADSVALTLGAGADLSITHNGTNTVATSATGDLVIDNTNTTGSTINQLGTDTTATDFQVQNDSGTALFTVDGAGDISTPAGILMTERSTPSAAATSTGYVYTKDDSDNTELFFFSDLDGTDTEVQITKNGFLNADALVSTEFVAATGGVTAGDVLYLASGTEVGLADATTSSGADFVVGIAGNTALAAAEVQLLCNCGTSLTTGTITGFSAAGDVVYLSETAGDLTTTAPTASGSTIYRVGFAVTATSILFSPELIGLNP